MEFHLNEKQLLALIIVVVILFCVLLLFPIFFGSLNYFGVIDVPFLPKASVTQKVLVIGEPSLGERVVLDNLSFIFTYSIRNANSFGATTAEELNQYAIVILDQNKLATKSVTVELGDGIQKYVANGGKLIIVMNSGVYQSVGLNGSVANDVVGWKATFGNIIPAECVPQEDGSPSCAEGKELSVVGRIWMQDFDHPIMEGIEVAPPIGEGPLALTTLAIQPNEGAKTIAYIKSENNPKTYPAILEKKHIKTGTVIYFNYDPGLTPGIFKNTLYYLK